MLDNTKKASKRQEKTRITKETINAEPIPAKDWKIEQYELALKNGIITDVNWKDRLDSNPTAAEIFAMLNKLK